MQKKEESQSVGFFTVLLLLVTMISNLTSIVLGILNSQKNDFFHFTLEELINKYQTENTPQLTSSVLIFTLVYTFNTVGLIYLFISTRFSSNLSPVKITPSLIPNIFGCAVALQLQSASHRCKVTSLAIQRLVDILKRKRYNFCVTQRCFGLGQWFLTFFIPWPIFQPKSFLLSCNVAYLSSIAWSFLFDKEFLEISCGLQVNATIFLWTAAFISFRSSRKNLPERKCDSKTMLWLVRLLIQNGICLFATWAFVTSTIGFAFALVYKNSPGLPIARLRGIVSMEDGSTIALIILMVGVVVLFIMEIFVYWKYFKYILTTVPVFIATFAGIVANLHIKKAHRNLKLCFVGMTLSMAFFVVKIVFLSLKIGKKNNKVQKKMN